MKLILIAAVAKNGVIGKNNTLPWNLPKDMQHFRTTTKDHPIVMGRRNFESIGHPLPNRRNIILSKTLIHAPAGTCVYSSWEDARKTIEANSTVYIIGGSEIYALFLPIADEVLLTEIQKDFDGNVFFPFYQNGHFKYPQYKEISRTPLEDVIPAEIVTYRKI